MTEIEVVNVVASAVFGLKVDLVKIADAIEGAKYEKKRFPGLVYHLAEPKCAVLLFSSGKMVCTGARTVKDVHRAIKIILTNVAEVMKDENKDFDPSALPEPSISIENIVATCDLKAKINLTSAAITLGFENIEYEPEQFPALVYHSADPKVVMLFFGSGKIVCTGAKCVEDIKTAIDNVRKEMELQDLI